MLGHETRGAALEEDNAVGPCRLRQRHKRRVRRETRTCTAGGADTAHRGGVRRRSTAIAGIIVVAAAMLVHMRLGRSHAAMVRLAGRRQSAGVAAQRQSREQHDQQDDTAGALHAENPNIGTVQRPLLRDSVPVVRMNCGWLSRHVSPAGPMCCTMRAQAGTRAPSRHAADGRRPRVVSFRSNVS